MARFSGLIGFIFVPLDYFFCCFLFVKGPPEAGRGVQNERWLLAGTTIFRAIFQKKLGVFRVS
jgi:hypothetical protein